MIENVKPKQLILLLDGTWNDDEEGPCDTNIVRLREFINKSLESDPLEAGSKRLAASRKFEGDDVQRIIFYERGVGTGGFLDPIFGGAFGEGLGDNVRRAYRFLSFWYAPGDQIFIFGFSRGAYTARSLVGMIEAAGLLKREFCDETREAKVWGFYRTNANDRLPADLDSLTPYVHDRTNFMISCVGVFDTVGSLGVPLPMFRRDNRAKFGFHSVELGSITECALHALATDEHREPFQAALWRKPKFKAFKDEMTVEQVWFSGAHSDVGGGYIKESERLVAGNGERRTALDDITLDWMLKRVLANFPNFPVRRDRLEQWRGFEKTWANAQPHNSRSFLYSFWPYFNRAINNYEILRTFWPRRPLFFHSDRCGCYDRHVEAIGEMVHISVLLRYGQKARFGFSAYAPRNIRAVLPLIFATYAPEKDPLRKISFPRQILVVNWSGEPLDPNNDSAKVLELFQPGKLIRKHLDQRMAELGLPAQMFGKAES